MIVKYSWKSPSKWNEPKNKHHEIDRVRKGQFNDYRSFHDLPTHKLIAWCTNSTTFIATTTTTATTIHHHHLQHRQHKPPNLPLLATKLNRQPKRIIIFRSRNVTVREYIAKSTKSERVNLIIIIAIFTIFLHTKSSHDVQCTNSRRNFMH